MNHRLITSSLAALLAGCSGTAPERTAVLLFPQASSAVQVSSARFFAVDPDASLNNSAMRNCRFGRTTKIPMVPALVELSLTELRIAGVSAGALVDGRLEEEHRAALAERLASAAAVNRTLSSKACHPWRSGPEDASVVPALLIAADQRVPAGSLEAIIDRAWEGGFEEVALWVAAPGSAPAPSGKGTSLTPSGGSVAEVIAEVDRVRAGGDPCVLLVPREGAEGAVGTDSGSPVAGALSGVVPVIPVARSSNRRLVSGEICGEPPEQLPDEVVSP